MLAPNVMPLQEVGGVYPRCLCGDEFFFYHKSFCVAHCRQFLLGAVSGSLFNHNAFLMVYIIFSVFKIIVN
jgi:hypothetical protein